LAIAPETYQDALESGLTPSDMKAMAADAGAPLRYLDSLTDWAPIRVPAECSPELRARFDVSTDHSFRMCEKLGLTSILAVAGYDKGTVELSRLIDGFGRLCDRAQREGYWIDLEFMPFWGMPNLSDAWAIVDAVNRCPVRARGGNSVGRDVPQGAGQSGRDVGLTHRPLERARRPASDAGG
jgi:hypothetical protein